MVREKGCVCLELCPCPMSILINTLSPCHLKSKISIYFIPLEKGPMTEYVVFFRKHAVLNVFAFYLVNVYLT